MAMKQVGPAVKPIGAVVLALVLAGFGAQWWFGTHSLTNWGQRTPPKLFDLNGDGVDEIFGEMRVGGFLSGAGPWEKTLLNGASFERLWGVRADATCFSGKNFIAITERTVAIVDTATGTQRFAGPIADYAAFVCVSGDRATVHAIDETVTTYNLASATVDNGAPVPCTGAMHTGHTSALATCDGETFVGRPPIVAPREVPGFTITVKEKGSHDIVLHGDDGAGHETWSKPVDDLGETQGVVDGIFVRAAYYNIGYDIKTGEERYNKHVGYPIAGRIAGNRLYVVTSGVKYRVNLVVMDARTGETIREF